MSREIDERVVQMRFDNQDFESKAQKTLGVLKNLNKSLDATESVRGLEHLGDVTKGFDFNPLIGSIGAVHDKFSAFEIMAVTALQNITNSAINTGKQLVKSLTIDQVTKGWDKFDSKTKSVGTLVSQGNRLEEVNDAMNRLATFTDETSYDMVSMTESIAKFTATGKGLDDSLTAMEGIALWAAASGQNAQKASSAMYQLSQALGAGVMRKEDYKSIQNLSMDTDEFRQVALDTAVALGTLRDNADGTYESLVADTNRFSKAQFAEHLTQDQWFNSDVMMEVYKKYAGGWDKIAEVAEEKGMTVSQAIRHIEKNMSDFDITEWELKIVKAGQEARSWGDAIDSVKDAVSSGWTRTFELIFGDYEEATSLWTDLANSMYDVFAEPGNTRNELLQGSLMSGWKQLVDEGIKNSDAYKDEIITVAREHGIAIDSMIEDAGSFEESLKNGWATSGIFSEALQNLTDKTAGLSAEQLEELGLTEKQAEAFARVNDRVKEGDLDLDEYIDKMSRMSGRENLLQAFWDTWEAIADILGTVKRAFNDVFPPATADSIYTITERIRDMASGFKSVVESLLGLNSPLVTAKEHLAELSGDDEFDRLSEAASNFKDTFRGVFAVMDIVLQAAKALFGGLMELIAPMGSIGSSVLGVTGSLGDFIYGLDQTIKETGVFKTAVHGAVEFLKRVPKQIALIFQQITGLTVGDVFDAISNKIKSFKDTFMEFISSLRNGSKNVSSSVSGLSASFAPFKVLFGGLRDLIAGLVPLFASLGVGVGKAMSAIGNGLAEALRNGDIERLFDLVNKGVLTGIGLSFKKFIDGIIPAAKDSLSIKKALTSLFEPLTETLTNFKKSVAPNTLIKIAASIGVLAASMAVLAGIDSDRLYESVMALGLVFTELFGSMAIFEKSVGGKKLKGIKSAGGTLIAVAVSISVLANAVKKISELDPERVMQGLVGVGVMLGEMAAFLKLADFDGVGVRKGLGLLLMAAALNSIATVITELGNIDKDKLIQGLVGLGAALTELGIFLSVTDFDGMGMIKGAGLLLMAASLKIIASVIEQIGDLQLENLAKGLISLGVMLGEVFAFTLLMSSVGVGGVVGIGAGLVVLSTGIMILATALKLLGSMSLAEMGIAIGGLGIALLELGVAVTAMQGTAAGAAALLVVSMAIGVLVPALKSLGSMSIGELITSLVALAGTFAIIGVSAMLLAPVAPVMVAFGAGVALLGVGLLGCATACEVFAVSLGTLAVSGGAGIGALIASIAGLIGLVPAFVKALFDGIVGAIAGLGDAIPELIQGLSAIIVALCQALIDSIPSLVAAAGTILDAALVLLTEYVPKFVDGGINIVISILNGVAEKIPDVIDAAINLVISFIEGLAQGIDQNAERAAEAMRSLGRAILNAFKAFFGIHSPSTVMNDQGTNLIQGLINGIGEKIADAKEKIRELGQKMLDRFLKFKSDFKTAAKNVISGLISGVREKLSSAWDAAQELGSKLLGGLKKKLGIASPSKEMAKLGKFSTEGFIGGLLSNAKLVGKASDSIGEVAMESLEKAFSKVGDESISIIDDPVITPVLDLSRISDGVSRLNSLLSITKGVDLAAQVSTSVGAVPANQNATMIEAIDRLDSQISGIEVAVENLKNAVDVGLSGTIAGAVKESLNGVGISMDRRAVGQIITNYQDGVSRRGGR